jgi:hypothetical protein
VVRGVLQRGRDIQDEEEAPGLIRAGLAADGSLYISDDTGYLFHVEYAG